MKLFYAIRRYGKWCHRLGEMIAIVLHYQLDRKFDQHSPLLFCLRIICLLYPRYRRLPVPKARAECLRLALQTLGPIAIKFGQILSLQSDRLPPDVIEALEQLQDRVKPFDSQRAIEQITQALGKPIDVLFQAFDHAPLAAASIAQVHRAVLPCGKNVVVKVLRPHLKERLAQDIALLYRLARWLPRLWKEGRRLQPVALVTEFERCIGHEINLRYEAANANQLKHHFRGNEALIIPCIYWPYVTEDLLVLEYMDGIPVNQIDRITRQGIPLKLLAKLGVEIFLKQVFDHSFFHADMHPGNILVAKSSIPRYMAVDFGIMGSLSQADQYYIAANLLAFFKRDYRQVASLHVQSGWVDKQTNVLEFEATIRTLCEPVFARPLKDISLASILLQLFQTAGRFDMKIQPQLLLLQKTLISVEAMGKRLDPELNLWETAMPQLENWMQKQFGMRSVLVRMWKQFPHCLERLPALFEKLT